MIRRRKVPLLLEVCIGIFLLLFSTVAADAPEGPPLIPEWPFAANASETSIAEENKAIPNKIPSRDGTEVGSEDDKKVVEPFNSTRRDLDTARSEIIKDAKAEDEEKVSTPDTDAGSQGIRSRDQVDRLTTSDSANGGSRFEEVLYGTSGKSSSTKTTVDNIARLSRTNDLTTVATKLALDESKFDEKANETSSVQLGNDTVHRVADASARSLENDESAVEFQRKAEVKPTASSKESSRSSALESGTIDPGKESATRKVVLEELQERIKKADSKPTKNSEVPDLEKDADSDAVSLINDTSVNYSHHPKTSTEKDSEASSGTQRRASENVTNFISPESTVSHVPGNPKGDVEVVENVTHPVIAKAVEQDSTMGVELTNERNQERLIESTTQKGIEETSPLQAASSPVPRGRTIAFSDLNEYPSLEIKPTIASKTDVPLPKKNVSGEKVLEQKPYPYLKSHNSSNRIDASTEEPSALENTIGRGQSEEKFAVTEASDVLENSIQLKASYHEKGNESSTVSTTELRSAVPMTTMSLVTPEEARSTIQSADDKSNNLKAITGPEEKSSGTGNDVPGWGSEGREAITGKGNFDVTGNGITEVTLKPESSDKRTYEESLQDIVGRTTIAPLEFTVKPQTDGGMASNADVQTNAESSLLIRSALNATELSTEYPLIKESLSEAKNSTIPIAAPSEAGKAEGALSATTIEEVPTGNATETPVTPDTNGTNEIPSVSGTLSPDEAFAPTTTSVEYEFVGLSEATTSPTQNTTEEAWEVGGPSSGVSTIVPSVQDLFTKSFPIEASTISTVTVTENSLASGETDVTNVDDRSTSTAATDQTTVPTSISSPTTQSRDDFATLSSVVKGETDESSTTEGDVQRASTGVDSWTTLGDDEVVSTPRTEQTLVSDSKDPRFVLNITETVTEAVLTANVSTSTERVVTAFATSSLRPRVPGSSSTTVPTVSDVPMEEADVTKVTAFTEEITSFVRIVMEGSSYDVCPKMDKLKLTLAEILIAGMNKSVSDKQIIFHQDPCRESSSSTPTASDMPLTSIRVHVVDENGKFDSSMTNSLPALYKEFRDRVKFPVTEPIPDSGNAIAVVVVSSVAFICLVLLTGLLFIMRKRQTRFNYGERCRPVSLDAYSLDSVSAYNSVRRKGIARSSKRSYGNPTFEDSSAIPSHPLSFAGLSSFCNDINTINEEFAGIPQVSAKIDELPTGAEVKNRYANVIPLPETRVPLQKMNNDPLTEYINASYVRGPKNAMRYYIACQAPMESTVTDFWRMIWEQQSKVIIMLTDLVENGVEKCTEYIPPSEITDCHRLYGDYQVTLKKRETKEKYAISTLHLKNLENNTFREVYHIWYLWPVNGAQSDGAGLIAVLLEARALQRGGPGPIVVHCSPGTGRTGTLIALDLGIRQYEITRTVDVPRVVYTIRRDRAGAVQTKEQYAFIYKALNLYATKLAGGVLDST